MVADRCYGARHALNSGLRYVQLHPAQNFVQEVCRRFQPCTWAQTNPTPGLTLTLTIALWGARGRQGQSRGSATFFCGVFRKIRRAAEIPALTGKTRTLHSVLCRMQLHIGPVLNSGFVVVRRRYKLDLKNPGGLSPRFWGQLT